MSALGQKQTYAAQNVMSALPPNADMCGALAHVCFGPIADIACFNPDLWLGRLPACELYHRLGKANIVINFFRKTPRL
jgi:hypothetical protein